MMLTTSSGCEPLTPDDIAEVVVFTATRRENVVIADTLVFPSHQVRHNCSLSRKDFANLVTLGWRWCYAPKRHLDNSEYMNNEHRG